MRRPISSYTVRICLYQGLMVNNIVLTVLKHVKENEAVKLIRLKEGFVKMSNAYIEMSHKCNTVFTAQRVIIDIFA